MKELKNNLNRNENSIRDKAYELNLTRKRVKYSYWNSKEVKYLKDNYLKLKIQDLKNKLNRYKSSIVSKAFKLNLTKDHFYWNEKDIEYLKESYSNIDSNLLKLKLNLHSWSSIKSKAFDLNLKREMKGENSCHWKGGISFEPYCLLFNEEFKENIREKFNSECFICGLSEELNGKKLSIHHVSYNKNCLYDNSKCYFIPLCSSCHSRTNFNRKIWEKSLTVYCEDPESIKYFSSGGDYN